MLKIAMRNKILIVVCAICLEYPMSYGQSSLTVSTPTIFSKVSVPNNWSPNTAVNRINQFKGNAIGTGIILNYSFRPPIIFKNKYKNVELSIGLGYFSQRFNIIRYFNYNSPIYIVYSTNHYSYESWQVSVGLNYNYPIGKKYFLSCGATYTYLQSFQQDYTPNSGDPTQINRNNIDFGKMILLSLGVKRKIQEKIAIGFNLLIPHLSWRNDEIFKDDPSKFFHPSFSLGGSINVSYLLKKNISTTNK
ncbi:MAG: hypothetical protein JST48_12745 [Bacteroidetes bacterium]|nr:hypothetical protein [Bacteroidota bacterium]